MLEEAFGDDDENGLATRCKQVDKVIQRHLDKTTSRPKSRWSFLVLLFCAYVVRVVLKQGFYIVTYALGIYLLNLFLNFLSPAEDPEEAEDPERDEYRPFSRKLSEFKFWLHSTRAVSISLFLTCFELFDVPVFWPILLAYFLLLCILSMKDRLKHMHKHNYLPLSRKKQKYDSKSGKSKEDSDGPLVPGEGIEV
mmetsp:Transcript_55652/g.86422  ORF Transcript_55652/g.86422 Transcript_55652/m.86422 type:complete len:195 (-) Transcript_55652:11-595(-)